jgi:hypothetical protein
MPNGYALAGLAVIGLLSITRATAAETSECLRRPVSGLAPAVCTRPDFPDAHAGAVRATAGHRPGAAEPQAGVGKDWLLRPDFYDFQ